MSWDDRRGPRGSGGFDKLPEIDLNKFVLPPFKSAHIAGVVGVMAVLWLLTGLYRVELQERAVVMLFGVHTKTTGPGLHWNAPGPIGRVIKVRLEEIKRVEIGFRTDSGQISANTLRKESLMLTEGANMIDIQMSVQYQIKDPSQFLFGVSDRFRKLSDRGLYETVKNVAEAALREVVGTTEIDSILTVGKSKVQDQVHTLMQEILDRYGAGLTISLVQLQDVHPPQAVRESFRDVNNAEEDKNRLIREAEGFYNSVIPETRGQAAAIIAGAEAYRAEVVNRSSGDALGFKARLKEYAKAPEITRTRLYLEMMQGVLADVEKVVMDPKIAGGVLPFLPLKGDAKIEIKGSN